MTVKLLEELNDFEKLGLIPISYSRLNTLDMCEAKYFFSYILKEPQVFGSAATLGNIIHKVLEDQLEPDQPILNSDLGQYINLYYEQIPIFDPNSEIPEELLVAGENMLVEFVDRHNGESFQIEEKEKGFVIVVGNAMISGYIDRVDVVDDVVYITDYKSGKREEAQKNVHKNIQLGIYALAMKHLFPEKKIHASLYYLRSGKQKGHLFTDDDLQQIELLIIELVDKLINKSNFSYTPNTFMCKFCDYAVNGACSVGAKRVQH
jgi:ATP-dependent helicase/DNAse subunit B